MTDVSFETLLPRAVEIADGNRVYRSTHVVTIFNDSGADFLYNVEATMFDTLGHSASASGINVVATSGDSGVSSGVYVVDLDADLYESGVELGITCETHVTGGFSAVDRQTGTLTTG